MEEVSAESSSTVPAGSGPCAAARLEPGGCSTMASRSCTAVHAMHRQRRSSQSLVAACSGDASVLHATAPLLLLVLVLCSASCSGVLRCRRCLLRGCAPLLLLAR